MGLVLPARDIEFEGGVQRGVRKALMRLG